MSGLLKDLSDIVESAKGNFFPTSHILREALVVAKRIKDREFETLVNNERRGYKSGSLPRHRRIRGKVMIVALLVFAGGLVVRLAPWEWGKNGEQRD